MNPGSHDQAEVLRNLLAFFAIIRRRNKKGTRRRELGV
ncbi:unnamed protein product, partial [Vitis vinifera]